jgi:hypothetical protein
VKKKKEEFAEGIKTEYRIGRMGSKFKRKTNLTKRIAFTDMKHENKHKHDRQNYIIASLPDCVTTHQRRISTYPLRKKIKIENGKN